MAITSSFFNDVDGDRLYSAEDFAAYFSKFIGNGVYTQRSNAMMVTATEEPSLSVEVKPGCCFINGYQAEITDVPEKITLDDPTSKPRYDRIVARLDLNERKIKIDIITGMPSEEPIVPDIVRNGVIYDLGLAVIYIDANAFSISSDKIEDTRPYADVCGFVTGLIKQINMDDVLEEYRSAWDRFLENLGESDYVTIDTRDKKARINSLCISAQLPFKISGFYSI